MSLDIINCRVFVENEGFTNSRDEIGMIKQALRKFCLDYGKVPDEDLFLVDENNVIHFEGEKIDLSNIGSTLVPVASVLGLNLGLIMQDLMCGIPNNYFHVTAKGVICDEEKSKELEREWQREMDEAMG